MMDLLTEYLSDHPYAQWIIGGALVVVTFVVLEIVKGVLASRLIQFAKRLRPDLEPLFQGIVDKTRLIFLVLVSLYMGTLPLSLGEMAKQVATSILVVVCLFQAGLWGSVVISYFLNRYVERKREHDLGSATTIKAIGALIKGILWAALLLIALDNVGVNITALIAGLGVGGVAIALAVQNILGDVFSSLTIILDRPFVIGDFIIIDSYMGTVEKIGLKTTRIRSLSGELLVFGNSDLLSSRIRNYQQMQRRRIQFCFGVVYQTSYEKLKLIPGMVEQVIGDCEGVRMDRVHFKSFGASSLDFEVVYWVHSADYAVYMDRQQTINLALFQKFEENGIEFAYPTQTLFVEPPQGQEKASS